MIKTKESFKFLFRQKNAIALIFAFAVAGVFALVLSIGLPQHVSMANQPQFNMTEGEIYRDRTCGQTFIANHNNLNAIELLLATYNRKNTGRLVFHLRESPASREDILTIEKEMSEIQDNAFHRFSFPEIENSKGKNYYFFLEAPEAAPGNAITIWSFSGDVYKEGEKIMEGKPSHGDLYFKTEYNLGWRLSGHALSWRLSRFLKFFIGLFGNTVFYFVLLLFLFTWGFVTFVKKFSVFQRKRGSLLVYLVIFLAVSLGIILIFSKKIVVYDQFVNTGVVGEIIGEMKAGQTFVAHYNQLTAVDILLGAYRKENRGDLIFHLKEDGKKEDIHRFTLDMSRIKDNMYYRFRFPKIKDSRNKNYYFYLEAPKARSGESLTLWCNDKEDKYEEGAKIINGEWTDGDLVFRTVYDLGMREKIGVFLEEITQNKPFPLNAKAFYLILIGLFMVTSSLFLTYLVKLFIKS